MFNMLLNSTVDHYRSNILVQSNVQTRIEPKMISTYKEPIIESHVGWLSDIYNYQIGDKLIDLNNVTYRINNIQENVAAANHHTKISLMNMSLWRYNCTINDGTDSYQCFLYKEKQYREEPEDSEISNKRKYKKITEYKFAIEQDISIDDIVNIEELNTTFTIYEVNDNENGVNIAKIRLIETINYGIIGKLNVL